MCLDPGGWRAAIVLFVPRKEAFQVDVTEGAKVDKDARSMMFRRDVGEHMAHVVNALC